MSEPRDDVYEDVAVGTQAPLRIVRVAELEANLDAKLARANGERLTLTVKEFDLLAMLMEHAGRIVTRRELLDGVWEPDYPDHNKTLEVHVKRLRDHLAAVDPALRHRLRTVRGHGYVIDL